MGRFEKNVISRRLLCGENFSALKVSTGVFTTNKFPVISPDFDFFKLSHVNVPSNARYVSNPK